MGVKGGSPRGRGLLGLGDTGAYRPSMPPSPWCLPAASEVAPSCLLPQAPLGHPIPTPASWGTLLVPRSRSSWKHLNSTRPSWYAQLPGAWVGLGRMAWMLALWGAPLPPEGGLAVGERPQAARGPQGWRWTKTWAPLPPSLEGLGLSSLGAPADFCSPVSHPLSWRLYCRCSDRRAVSHAVTLKVTLSRSVPAFSSCLVGRRERAGEGRAGPASLLLHYHCVGPARMRAPGPWSHRDLVPTPPHPHWDSGTVYSLLPQVGPPS